MTFRSAGTASYPREWYGCSNHLCGKRFVVRLLHTVVAVRVLLGVLTALAIIWMVGSPSWLRTAGVLGLLSAAVLFDRLVLVPVAVRKGAD